MARAHHNPELRSTPTWRLLKYRSMEERTFGYCHRQVCAFHRPTYLVIAFNGSKIHHTRYTLVYEYANHHQRKPVLPPAKGVPAQHPTTVVTFAALFSAQLTVLNSTQLVNTVNDTLFTGLDDAPWDWLQLSFDPQEAARYAANVGSWGASKRKHARDVLHDLREGFYRSPRPG